MLKTSREQKLNKLSLRQVERLHLIRSASSLKKAIRQYRCSVQEAVLSASVLR